MGLPAASYSRNKCPLCNFIGIMPYVIFTAKHHDGFGLFPSKGDPRWNSVVSGPNKDIVGLLAKSVRKYGMKFGIYYSLLEWHNKLYPVEKNSSYGPLYVENVMLPDIKKLINNYKPSVLWTDGDWAEEEYGSWRAEEILAWIYNNPLVRDEIVVNDRWGMDKRNIHGDFFNGDHERYNPGSTIMHKWENAFTLDKGSWGYVQDMYLMDFEELLETVVSTVSGGGNALINVGPMKNGTIPTVFEDLLLRLGEWLQMNGEAIYDTSPWSTQNDTVNTDVWYTCKRKTYNTTQNAEVTNSTHEPLIIYAIFLKWPENGYLRLKDFISPLEDYKYYNFYFLNPSNNASETKRLKHHISDNGYVYMVRLPSDLDTTNFISGVLKIIPVELWD